MKQVKAFIHRNRVSDVLHALEDAGFRQVSLFDVKALLHAMDPPRACVFGGLR